jgi:hypothetical protein
MSAPTYEDANIMLQLSRLGAEQGNSRAARFIWSDKFIEEFADFNEKFPPGTKEYQYATRICGWYETVGALWVNGLINEKLLSDWLAVGLVWQRVKGFALGVREEVGEPKIYEHFEALAKKLS